jgi:hypothetical protein
MQCISSLSSFFFFLSEVMSHHVAQVGFELLILLPQPPKCWDYRPLPPHPAPDYVFHSRNFSIEATVQESIGNLSQGSRCKIAEDGGRDPKFEALSLRN